MYQLFTISGSCSTAIHVLLNSLNVPVEIIKREDVPNYSDLVPSNAVPALKDGDRIITEGVAIVLYLLEKHNIPLTRFNSSTYGDNTDFMQHLLFNYATLHPAYGKLFSMAGLLPQGEQKQIVLQQLANKASSLWQIVDKHLANQKYMVSEAPSIVDYLLAVYANWGNAFEGIKIELGSNVRRLISEVSELPEFKRAYQVESANFALPA
jgi:glutathione S-transferase